MSIVRPAGERKLDEFTVDLDNREVHHKCGASISFYEYVEPGNWLLAGGSVRNGYLFNGSLDDFLRLTKEAALAPRMTH